MTLLAIFVVLLAGRFTLGRLGAFPAWDLRWAGFVVIGLLCLAWATVAREKTAVIDTGALLGWFLAWAGWMALSVGWTPPGARITAGLVNIGMLAAVIWAAWSVAGRVDQRVLGAVWWWMYTAGWLYFLGALAAGPDEQGRHSAFGGGPNVFARIMALAVLAALVLAVTTRKSWMLIGLPPFLLGAYLSGSRGGLLSLLIVVFLGGPMLVRRMSRGGRTALVLGSLLVLVVASFFYDPAWLAFGQDRFVEKTFEQGYDSGRTGILERALQLFDEHLWFGTGLDGFYVLQGGVAVNEYPHNLIVATAAEGGLVGLGLLFAALAAGAVALYRRRPLGTEAIGFALAAVLQLVAAMFSGDYYDSRFFWFFLGLAVIRAQGGRTDGLAALPGYPNRPSPTRGIPGRVGRLGVARRRGPGTCPG
jgi:O-antigen ligase